MRHVIDLTIHGRRAIQILGCLVFGGWYLAASPAIAGPDEGMCGSQPLILDLADDIIRRRLDVPGFGSRNYGGVAAYFKLRYGDLSLEEGLAMLRRLKTEGRRPARYVPRLELSYAVSKLGVRDGLAATGIPAPEAFAGATPLAYREIILADAGKSFFELVHEVRRDPGLAEIFEQNFLGGMSAVTAILDQSDGFKLEFASNAERAGELPLAGIVLASRENLAPYHAFLSRHKGVGGLKKKVEEAAMGTGAIMMHQNTPPAFVGEMPGELRSLYEAGFYIYKAGFLVPELDFLNIAFQQASQDLRFVRVASDYIDARLSGGISDQASAEDSWLFLYRGLVREIGVDETRKILSSFDISSRFRHFAGSAADTFDWMIALEAILPHILVESASFPACPGDLPEDFDWDDWVAVAELVRNHVLEKGSDIDRASLSEDQVRIAAELLFRAGAGRKAIEIVRKNMEIADQMLIERDFMKRLDLECEGYLRFPGKGVLLGGFPMFGFQSPGVAEAAMAR